MLFSRFGRRNLLRRDSRHVSALALCLLTSMIGLVACGAAPARAHPKGLHQETRPNSKPLVDQLGLQLSYFPRGWQKERATSKNLGFADIAKLSSCLGVPSPSSAPHGSSSYLDKVVPQISSSGLSGVSQEDFAQSLVWLRRSPEVAKRFVEALAMPQGGKCIVQASGGAVAARLHLTNLALHGIGSAVAGYSFELVPPSSGPEPSGGSSAQVSAPKLFPLPQTETAVSFLAAGRVDAAVFLSTIGGSLPLDLLQHLLEKIATRDGAVTGRATKVT